VLLAQQPRVFALGGRVWRGVDVREWRIRGEQSALLP
jgi:hypothetical protein